MIRKLFRNSKQFQGNSSKVNPQDPLSIYFAENLRVFHAIYNDCSDIVFRTFTIGANKKAALIYIEGLSNATDLEQFVLRPLLQIVPNNETDVASVIDKQLAVSKLKKVRTYQECIQQISMGNPILLAEQLDDGFSLGFGKWEQRSIEEPKAESVIRGSREGFTETLGTNLALLRRSIRDPMLKTRAMNLGQHTETQVVVAFIEGITDPKILEEVSNRLQRIQIDGVLESSYIEELIEDDPFSPFPQVLNTERVDVAIAGLLEGRIVILVDRTPFVLIVPVTLSSLLQSAEDYYQRFLFGTVIRWLRYLFLGISLLLPSLYVAVITFHYEMVPTTLLISMARSREEIPFPALVEALLMEIVFEALREAGARMPKQIGSAISIVGALVIGDAAVSAGLVSAPMVIVVAMTGVASLTIPRYSTGIALRLLRFPIIMLAGTLGLLGVMLGLITIIIHLCKLRSFGVPYLSPVSPIYGKGLRDVLLRAPLWMLNTRPQSIVVSNDHRQSANQEPQPGK